MSRLIDAEVLIENIGKKKTISQHIDCIDVMNAIRETETAFDKDNVIEQLKDVKENCKKAELFQAVIMINRCIDIVKEGGIV